ncbi:ESX-5 secretion system ATPase EccB5 [Mycolicibacterium hassiacum DSM 44199]|jgi:type VII secretion protein EccB|uniref:type VII secretion protein EccB n=1 Tax=Mycolicibacterium hassiacum TaxID=46351 RepID=UPI00035EEB32|nr:type VII secretion protein EccB [Mycolicibacterium hassiacum]MDA4087037.1 type VII secretion protein [Mycolicibacterium hassiacum DSM 44199]PZN15378.1 MAG: type VII secretion protein EccB [Mycolicibacterium hassiacum]VCT88637.1 ESX-5 secretion system ATPase EccB5 [Mycolicibacterium hassiacum DSM 44199]
MTREPTTRLQASGHRFLVRRMTHALVRGDVRMLDDPLRGQSVSLAVGCVLAALGLVGAAAVAMLRPAADVGDAPIVVVRESGAVYVRVGDTMHPALNLASARLIAGTPAEPKLVSAAAIDRSRRGPTVGIVGAPDTVAPALDATESGWTVCDADETTVLIGFPEHPASGRGALVTPAGESAAVTYYVYDGRRARVDLRNPAVVRALRLENVAPRPVSPALLELLPEVPAIAPPHIPGLGEPSALPGIPVGTVVRLARADGVEFHVALRRGVQRIGAVAADLIRFTGGRVESVSAQALGPVPSVSDLPVSGFPDRGNLTDRPVLCVHWRWVGEPKVVVSEFDSLPDGGRTAVRLAGADGPGPAVDAVLPVPGRSAFVRAAGAAGQGAATGARYLVTDSGVVFGIADDDAAARLGLTGAPPPAPWPVLARLPRGPELSVRAASVQRDAVAPAP